MVVGNNKIVTIEYSLKDAEGNLLDSNKGFAPLEYLQGAGNIVPGLERVMEGMQAGESKEIFIAPQDAFGLYDEALKKILPVSIFGNHETLNKGDTVIQPDGTEAIVIDMDDNNITVDSNHPLAGIALQYEVRVNGIRAARNEELLKGFPFPENNCCSGEPGCC
jgi:FKBP-type peptidyl-prolyl cis-trans isomerase SlyD